MYAAYNILYNGFYLRSPNLCEICETLSAHRIYKELAIAILQSSAHV